MAMMAERVERWTVVSENIKALLLGLVAIVFILFGMPQMITGVIVNMILIIMTEKLGAEKAMLLGMITPIVASFSCVLPMALIFMVPFIAIGNSIYINVYAALMRKNRFAAVLAGAFLKFAFLYAVVSIAMAKPVSILIGSTLQVVNIPQVVAVMMSWPQLFTAVTGGVLAIGVLSLANKLRR